LDGEREGRDEQEIGPLAVELAKAQPVQLADIEQEEVFQAPKYQPPRRAPGTSSIQYTRPVEQINALKHALGASSNREVGERSFDYAYRAEVDDDE
jgi:hypothetical protein